MLNQVYNKLVNTINNLIYNTDLSDGKSVKRTKNYIEWCNLKTDIINNEQNFQITDEQNNMIKRGNVIWVNFGFNIGCEFGGRHPAIIVKKMGNGVYVIPVDSGKIPESKKQKDYYINIRYIFNFPVIPRYCNVYNLVCIDPRRFDFNNGCGRVHGKIMSKISKSLRKNVVC